MNYLIIKTSSIGDIVQTFPVVDYLRTKDPGCYIDWIVEEEYVPLLKAHPHLTTVLTTATRRWRRCLIEKRSFQELCQTITALRKTSYDVVFDLQGNTKSGVITQMARSKQKVGFGWESTAEWPNFFTTNRRFNVAEELPVQRRYLSLVEQFFQDPIPFQPRGVELCLNSEEEARIAELKKSDTPRIMVAFASKWKNKTLSLATWQQFLQTVYEQKKCHFYFVSGTSQEQEMASQLASNFPNSASFQGLSFPLWQRMMCEMDLVIAVDSAALALCGTTQVPSFSFFGPTQANAYKPLGPQHHHFQGTCPYHIDFPARCPRLRSCPTGACLKQVSAETLVKAYQATPELCKRSNTL